MGLDGSAPRAPAAGGLRGWIFSTDNVRVGVLWIAASLLFFYVGGIVAILMRAELTYAGEDFVGAETYDAYFTLHGTFMVFFFAVVVFFGLGSILVPPLVGARQMAFPRLNTLDLWLILLGGLLLEVGSLLGHRPKAGWTSYTPLSLAEFSPGLGQDLWAWAIGIETLGGTLAGVNFAATILRERRPGLRMRDLPLVVWAFLLTSLLVLTAGPYLLTALAFMLLDRNLGTTFYDPSSWSATLLWQDLFWFYSHPATYIMFIPALGVAAAVIARFSARGLFSRLAILVGLVGITILSYTVWWHHMFMTGMERGLRTFAAVASWAIALPTGLIVFVWAASLRGGRARLTTPMLFALGLVLMVIVGGANGLYTAYVPFDRYVHGTYWVVAHIHYIIFGSTVLGIFAAVYYWFPAALHRQLDERLGKWHFWGTFVGMNLVFFPMHLLGLAGMRRRVHDYAPELEPLNGLMSAGMALVAGAMALFLVNLVLTLANAPRIDHDPWEPAPPDAPAR